MPSNACRTILTIAGCCLLLSGCQTNAGLGTVIGTTAGCAGGALLAHTTGHSPWSGCGGGAVLGGAAGYYIGHQKDLENARRTRDAIAMSAPDVAQVQLVTHPESVPESERSQAGAASIEKVQSMQVNVPQALVSQRDPRLNQPLAKIGSYVSTAQAPARVIVSARTQNDFNYMVSRIQKGYSQRPSAGKVTYQYLPQPRGTQSAVLVEHHKPA